MNAIGWLRLSCHDFRDGEVRLQLFALPESGKLRAAISAASFDVQRLECIRGLQESESQGITMMNGKYRP